MTKDKISFLELVEFFQKPPRGSPGDPEYNAAFCQLLIEAAPADAASIWQVDAQDQLHPIFSTDIPQDQLENILVRQGEGITGAVALSRQPLFIANAQVQTFHKPQVDLLFGLRTCAMISAPILFEAYLFGVLNILNHHSERVFPAEWKEWLSALAVMYAGALARAGKLSPYRALSRMEEGEKAGTPRVSKPATAIVGISQAMQEALHLCLKAGHTDIPVLICGETGTGKELAGRRIHESSSRAQGPFLEVNCAALTETLLESELFGHVKGAFTGATHDRLGKFVAASGGTLFLDEIGEMSLACQAKILRSLEEKKVTPLGSEKKVDADTRIIAATNRDLIAMIKEKSFREDLYYRICGIEIRMPPLRERVEDIPLLALHFLNKAKTQQKGENLRSSLRLSKEALETLMAFSWPGNVRQLEQAVLAAAALCEGDEITPDSFPAWLRKALSTDLTRLLPPPTRSDSPGVEPVPQEDVQFLTEERTRYLAALQATRYPGTSRWNVSAAARKLGMARETLAYRLRKMNLI